MRVGFAKCGANWCQLPVNLMLTVAAPDSESNHLHFPDVSLKKSTTQLIVSSPALKVL